ncbi:BRCT domain-containing DNA repair protein isoform X1 [Wolffia australiana]
MSDQKPHSLVSKSQGKKGNDYVHSEEHSSEGLGDKRTEASCQPGDSSEFSKLLEGVTFVLSGVVNPERNNLRSKALSMGAHYQPDWASDCSLLICAFPNTPKFRQVETDGGTIVSKDWINECYNQKKLVEIEKFLMHVGRPWRRSDSYSRDNQGNRMPEEVSENIKRRSHHKIGGSSRSEPGGRGRALDQFSPSKLKGLALKDLTETVLWLEKQEEKPEPNDIRTVAAEGIITCLQDAIEALECNQEIQSVADKWMFVPKVVNLLVDMETGEGRGVVNREELTKLAVDCKHAYQAEFYVLLDDQKTEDVDKEFDSESTIEMTEEEIDLAFKEFAAI